MEEIIKLARGSLLNQIIATLIVVALGFGIYKLLSKFLKLRFKKLSENISTDSRAPTYLKLSISVIRYVIIIFVLLTVLEIYNINVNSLLTGVGIVAVIGGLIVQDMMKDVIRGATILSDRYFKVGDVVVYNNMVGQVTHLGLVSTKIRNIGDNSILSVANRNIEQIQVLSPMQLLEVPLPYELSVGRSAEIMTVIRDELLKDELVTDCIYTGANVLDRSSVNHQLKLSSNPVDRDQARRNAYGIILSVLEKEGVAVPYEQIDIHKK